jgi:hypothetical protein
MFLGHSIIIKTNNNNHIGSIIAKARNYSKKKKCIYHTLTDEEGTCAGRTPSLG